MDDRPRRLHLNSILFLKNLWDLCRTRLPPDNGYVCQPEQCTTTPLGKQVASPGCSGSKQFRMLPGTVCKSICKPTLENNFELVDPSETESTCTVPDPAATVGWDTLVAPVNSLAQQKIPCSQNKSNLGNVLQLPGGANACPQVAPDLSGVIREALQRKQVSDQNIEVHLRQIRSLPTYNRAFQSLWSVCSQRGGIP